jgi:hypothetical protein
MKVVTWSERRGRFVLELPASRALLIVERLASGEWAWEYNAPTPRDDVRGRAPTAEVGMTKAFNAAVRAGMVDA